VEERIVLSVARQGAGFEAAGADVDPAGGDSIQEPLVVDRQRPRRRGGHVMRVIRDASLFLLASTSIPCYGILMPRIARVVFPGVPHHVTQRGNRQGDVFWTDEDRRRYLLLLQEYAAMHALEVWAWCLMTNHVHFVAVPGRGDSLARTFKPVDMRYSQYVNRTQHLTGHLWQGRPFSCPLDDVHLWAAVRYVERNPVRAALVQRAEAYPWSSAAAHCGRRVDPLLAGNLQKRGVVEDWASWLAEPDNEEILGLLRRRTRTGRPAGDGAFVSRLEALAGRILNAKPVGRPIIGKRP
jgi:putative transposase